MPEITTKPLSLSQSVLHEAERNDLVQRVKAMNDRQMIRNLARDLLNIRETRKADPVALGNQDGHTLFTAELVAETALQLLDVLLTKDK